MDIDLIIIDCEGTLLDSEALRLKVLAAAFVNLGAQVPRPAIAAALPGRSTRQAAAVVARMHEIALPKGFAAQCDFVLKVRAQGQVAPSAGIGRVLDMLRVPFCLMASCDPDVARALLQASGLGALVSDLAVPDDALAPMPAPDRLLDIADRKGVDPARLLVIDDCPAAMVAGLSVGASTLLYAANAPAEARAAWSENGTLDHWDDFPHGLMWPEASARVC